MSDNDPEILYGPDGTTPEYVRADLYQAAIQRAERAEAIVESLQGAAVIAAAHGFGALEPPSCMDCGGIMVRNDDGGLWCTHCGAR